MRDYVKGLTLAQVRTPACDKPLPEHPQQEVVPNARIPLLREVFALVDCYRAGRVRFNVETKVEAGAPEQTASRERFVQIVAREVRRARLIGRVTIQSFDIDDFGGSLVAGAASFGADAISPVHGNPQNGVVGDPGYVPYTTPALVREAHAAGLAVVPWTIDDPATMASLIDAGVDGIITDYPDRLRALLAASGYRLPRPVSEPRRRDCVAAAAV